jgi:DNA-directed RNA polymerase specialized sigma24 family protein
MSRRRPWQGDDSLDADGLLREKIRPGREGDVTDAYGDVEEALDGFVLETDEERIFRTRAARVAELDFMGRLTPLQVRAWMLYGQGLSLRETGRRMGIDHAIVKKLLQSAVPNRSIEEVRRTIQDTDPMERKLARNISSLFSAVWGKLIPDWNQ